MNRHWLALWGGALLACSTPGNPAPGPPAGVVLRIEHTENQLRVLHGAQPLLVYQTAPRLPRPEIDPVFQRDGYVASLYTPAGALVTDDYPPNHIHHHGVWFAFVKTAFADQSPDFWNMGEGTGRVELIKVQSAEVHGAMAQISVLHRHVVLGGPEPVTALEERWRLNVHAPEPGASHWRFDLESVITAVNRELALLRYHYGGLGVRGSRAWDGPEAVRVLTSEGYTRPNANQTRARWIHMWGLLEGARAGLAVLDHPQNFRSPQPLRVYPDEPYFSLSPMQLGDHSVRPGHPYISRYRIVVHDGELPPAAIEQMWRSFGGQPTDAVGALGAQGTRAKEPKRPACGLIAFPKNTPSMM